MGMVVRDQERLERINEAVSVHSTNKEKIVKKKRKKRKKCQKEREEKRERREAHTDDFWIVNVQAAHSVMPFTDDCIF